MSFYDYRVAQELEINDVPFYALIMAAMRKADSFNSAKLREAFPDVSVELQQRYNAPGGRIQTDKDDYS